MILQALTRYYENLLARGSAQRPGWAKAKVSYALELDDQGQVAQLLHLQQEVTKGNKKVLAPRFLDMPAPVKKTVNVASNFLCDNSSYLLGADSKGKPARTAECFAAAKQLHLELFQDAPSPAAQAIVRYFETWDPAAAPSHPALQEDWEELMKGGNLTFFYQQKPVAEDPAVLEAWQRRWENSGDDTEEALCLVTGQHGALARLHPSIKGVAGAQSSGASLVSFNAPAFCSYGHEQGANAPTGAYAAFAYTAALNTLLSDRDHVCRVGDTTILFWVENGDAAYQDCAMDAMFDAAYSESDLLRTLHQLAKGEPVMWDETLLDPSTTFYVLGLTPNAARLSVRFFWQNSFGLLAQNLASHYQRLQMVRPAYEKFPTLPIWCLAKETVRRPSPGSHPAEPNPRLAGDLLLSVLNDTPYPATLLNGVVLRIRAEHNISWGQASIIKAYYLKNSQNETLKEVMDVQLNESSTYLPYVLGRLFSVLEDIQQKANPGINTTIKDRYFNAASATPAMVFPTLLNLAQKHLAKLNKGQAINCDKRITELMGRITETLPARMSLPEQNAFQIGYYHETQQRYTKKEDKQHV